MSNTLMVHFNANVGLITFILMQKLTPKFTQRLIQNVFGFYVNQTKNVRQIHKRWGQWWLGG